METLMIIIFAFVSLCFLQFFCFTNKCFLKICFLKQMFNVYYRCSHSHLQPSPKSHALFCICLSIKLFLWNIMVAPCRFCLIWGPWLLPCQSVIEVFVCMNMCTQTWLYVNIVVCLNVIFMLVVIVFFIQLSS